MAELFVVSKQIYSRNGLRGFYVGLKPYMVYSMASWGVYFACYEFFMWVD
jgi:hypothetical protein